MSIDADRLNEIREWTAGEDGCDISADDAKFLLAALDAAEQRAELEAEGHRVLMAGAKARVAQAEQERDEWKAEAEYWADGSGKAKLEARATKATNALIRIQANAVSHHGDEAAKARALTVIGDDARAVLADLAAEEKK